jgi:molybdopterin-containing oxidoreductase family membrane subunit
VVGGLGTWGNNVPVGWAFGIINFVWWIGIGHAGAFISAFFFLAGQPWRASVNRLAEGISLFAFVNAGLFPILHLGRPWFFYWLVPYPARHGVWPNFKSTLPWDVAALAVHLLVALAFWHLGMLPDLAAARDRAPSRLRRRIYGVLALGWSGSGRQWRLHAAAYPVVAAIAAVLVITGQSVVSFDFASTVLPGWHSTLFPVYFVLGSIFSGAAIVALLLPPIRRAFALDRYVTRRHLRSFARLLVTLSALLAYCYAIDAFVAWYSGDRYARYVYLAARPAGTLAWVYWLAMALVVAVPQLLHLRRLRESPAALAAVGGLALAGLWLERYVLIVTSQARDFLPASWAGFAATWVDWALLLGSVALFGLFLVAFLRFAPFVSVHEVRRLAREEHARHGARGRDA